MHEQVSVPANGQAFELVEMRDGLLDHPADRAQPYDLLPAAPWNDRGDPLGAQPLPESRRVVAAVGQDGVGSAARMSDSPGDRTDRIDQIRCGLDVRDIPAVVSTASGIPVESQAT